MIYLFLTSVWRNSDSYENKKRSAMRGAQFVSIGMPTICWKGLSPNSTNMLWIRNSRILITCYSVSDVLALENKTERWRVTVPGHISLSATELTTEAVERRKISKDKGAVFKIRLTNCLCKHSLHLKNCILEFQSAFTNPFKPKHSKPRIWNYFKRLGAIWIQGT